MPMIVSSYSLIENFQFTQINTYKSINIVLVERFTQRQNKKIHDGETMLILEVSYCLENYGPNLQNIFDFHLEELFVELGSQLDCLIF